MSGIPGVPERSDDGILSSAPLDVPCVVHRALRDLAEGRIASRPDRPCWLQARKVAGCRSYCLSDVLGNIGAMRCRITAQTTRCHRADIEPPPVAGPGAGPGPVLRDPREVCVVTENDRKLTGQRRTAPARECECRLRVWRMTGGRAVQMASDIVELEETTRSRMREGWRKKATDARGPSDINVAEKANDIGIDGGARIVKSEVKLDGVSGDARHRGDGDDCTCLDHDPHGTLSKTLLHGCLTCC